jgi:Ni,Fe-hydrogenase maturation factor
MNKHNFLPIVAATAALAFVGCGKTESTTSTTSGGDSKSMVDSAVDTMKSTVTNVTSEVSKKVDSAIMEAQNFISQGKLQNALGSLTNLSSMTLTPEQQKTVDGLKAKIDTAMAATGKAVDSAKAAAGEASSAVQAKVTEAVNSAQALLKEGKFQDALTSLNGLSDLKLNADQSKLVNDLKAQIQTAMAAAKGAGADAAKAASDLFKKK